MATRLTGEPSERRKWNSPLPTDKEVVTKVSVEESLKWNPFFLGALTEFSAHLNNSRTWEVMPGRGKTYKAKKS